MDILKLLKNFMQGDNLKTLAPLIELLRDNAFDINKTVNSLTPEKLAPILKTFFQQSEKQSNFTAEYGVGGVTHIANIADGEIVYALNRYIGAGEE